MNKKTLKLMVAGICVASAFGGIAIGIAWATPGSGVTSATIAGPVLLAEGKVKSESDINEVEFETKGLTAARVVQFRIVPGGYTGWHSHPGPVFVMITAGTMTKYEAGNPNPAVYPAGTGFVESAGDVHNAGNAGNIDLQFTAFFLTPLGVPIRHDEPAP